MRAFPDGGPFTRPQRVYSKASLRSAYRRVVILMPPHTCGPLARCTLFQNFEIETKFVALQKATPINKQEYPNN